MLVDNGRSSILGTDYQSILHCIRCGACLDVCPVFRQIGGHAYNSTYSGPIGAVLNPLLEGLPRHLELPFASSLCGACSEVCSAGIPLADHLVRLRRDAVTQGLTPASWHAGFAGFAAVTERPRLFGLGERLVRIALRPWARGETVRQGPSLLGAWTRDRDLRLPARRSFRRLWACRPGTKGRAAGDARGSVHTLGESGGTRNRP